MKTIGFQEDLSHEFKSDKTCLPDNDIIDAVVAFANTEEASCTWAWKMMARSLACIKSIWTAPA